MEELPLGAHEIRLETGASGICHSDWFAAHGNYPNLALPMVLGHEGSGTVVDVGADVRRVRRGDRVICTIYPICGNCWQCWNGRTHLCEGTGRVGGMPVLRRDGADIPTLAGLGTMAERMTVNEVNVVKVETDLPAEQLALIGCGVTTGVGSALWAAEVKPGSTVAIWGCGGVGLSILQGARIAGAAEIIAIDPFDSKREAAIQFGATHSVDPTREDAVARVKEITRGRGAEYTFEAVSTLDTMRNAYDAACRGGTVTFVGGLPWDLQFCLPANAIHMEAKRILGSAYGSAQALRDIPRLVALAETGRLDLAGMVSRRIGLADVDAAFAAMERGEVIRSVILP
jgi:S-(hydroxymethyl)glutathione dehydrogenase/alcohol dehydrogenase